MMNALPELKPQDLLAAAMQDLGLTVDAVFVPWSQSRAKDDKETDYATGKPSNRPCYSLQWRVTLKRNGRDVLATDYGAGIAHCPSDKIKPPQHWDRPDKDWKHQASAWECEHGVPASYLFGNFQAAIKATPIMPDPCDVLHSLLLDGDPIDHPTYESWASDLGFDADSRKGEAAYRACLEIGLKLRAAIGEDGLAKLRAAAQDY